MGQIWRVMTTGLQRSVKQLRLAVRNWMNNTLYINAFDLTHRNVAQAVDMIERFKPTYMHGYCSGLYALAVHLLERGQGLEDVTLAAVVTESEKLYDFQRQAMTQAFQCPVAEHYGCVELGNVAAEEPGGTMPINEDLYIIEPGEGGAAVITNVLEQGYPFIRYRLGDMVELAPPADDRLPYSRLSRVIGRTVDMIPVPAGGYIHGVSLAHVIDPHLAKVRRYQVHQTAIDRFVVRLALRAPLTDAQQQKIVADLRQAVGRCRGGAYRSRRRHHAGGQRQVPLGGLGCLGSGQADRRGAEPVAD
jgi:phenylacetate-CoA ligase